MASVKWEGGKCHGAGETKAHFRHNEKEQRLKHEHANEHINKDLTPFNYSMYDLSYAEMCEKYDKRIAELSPHTRMTKVTVTCQILEIPAPADLPKHRQPEWFRRVHEKIIDFAGEENVIEGFVDVDEVHEYIDASTGLKRISMEHLHLYVVPEVDGKLNGKEFSSRKNINRLNNIIQEMSVNEFGVSFHTGKGGKSPKSVEQLKQESATLKAAQEIVSAEYADLCADLNVERMLAHEQLEAELEAKQKKAEKKLEDIQEEIEDETGRRELLKARNEEFFASNMHLTKENVRLKAENKKLAEEMAQKEQDLNAKEQAVKRQEAQARASKAKYDNLTVEAQNLVNKLHTVKPDEDMSRKKFMESIKLKDGTTAESRYQVYIAEENKRRKKYETSAKDSLREVFKTADNVWAKDQLDDSQFEN